MKKPLVTIVITTKNSASTLEKLLESIKTQSYPNIEVVVVDNNSTDSTKKIALKYSNKVFDKGPERSAQRNYGAEKSKGVFLLFLDSDMVLTKDVVKECVEKYGDTREEPGGVIIPEKSFGSSFWAEAKKLERDINSGEKYFEAARFFPRKIFNKMRGFDESITGPEDWDLPRSVARGYPIERIKSLIMHDEGDLSLKTLYLKKYYYGLSVHKYLKKQNIPVIGPTTIYFLRPAFYKNWRMMVSKPVVSLGMFVMLFVETLGGGLGYLKGRFNG